MSPTIDDRKAALFVLTLIFAGLLVRVLPGGRSAPAGSVTLLPNTRSERSLRDSVAAQAARLSQPLRRGERIDVDVAGELDLTRLPRVGPALARRIADDRESNGPFGSLEALGRVSGLGPRLLELLEPHISFSGHPAPSGRRGSSRRISINSASEEELAELPGIGPAKAEAIVKHRRQYGRFSNVDSLVQVTGIGPATVERLRPLIGTR